MAGRPFRRLLEKLTRQYVLDVDLFEKAQCAGQSQLQ